MLYSKQEYLDPLLKIIKINYYLKLLIIMHFNLKIIIETYNILS